MASLFSLHCLLRLLLLLSLQSVHVALEEVAVSHLELIDVLGVDDCGNFLVLVDSSHKTHELSWGLVGLGGRGYLRILKSDTFGYLLINKNS